MRCNSKSRPQAPHSAQQRNPSRARPVGRLSHRNHGYINCSRSCCITVIGDHETITAAPLSLNAVLRLVFATSQAGLLHQFAMKVETTRQALLQFCVWRKRITFHLPGNCRIESNRTAGYGQGRRLPFIVCRVVRRSGSPPTDKYGGYRISGVLRRSRALPRYAADPPLKD